jgi:hypothetical protein
MAITLDGTSGITSGGPVTATGFSGITTANLPTGSILKVYQVVKTDTFISASTSWANITGLTLTITPVTSSSKFLLVSDLSLGPNPGAGSYAQRFAMDGSALTGYVGDAAGVRPQAMASAYTGDTAGAAGHLGITKMYLHSPNTASSITYTVQVAGSTTVPGYVNRTVRDTNLSTYDARTASSFTVIEIAG